MSGRDHATLVARPVDLRVSRQRHGGELRVPDRRTSASSLIALQYRRNQIKYKIRKLSLKQSFKCTEDFMKEVFAIDTPVGTLKLGEMISAPMLQATSL
jgi:hypothetical protein